MNKEHEELVAGLEEMAGDFTMGGFDGKMSISEDAASAIKDLSARLEEAEGLLGKFVKEIDAWKGSDEKFIGRTPVFLRETLLGEARGFISREQTDG